MNNRSWTTMQGEEEEGAAARAGNDHLIGDKMRHIVERFRSRALRDVTLLSECSFSRLRSALDILR